MFFLECWMVIKIFTVKSAAMKSYLLVVLATNAEIVYASFHLYRM